LTRGERQQESAQDPVPVAASLFSNASSELYLARTIRALQFVSDMAQAGLTTRLVFTEVWNNGI
jgi:hypothetical protein